MRYVFLHSMQDVTLLTLSDVFSKQKRGIDSKVVVCFTLCQSIRKSYRDLQWLWFTVKSNSTFTKMVEFFYLHFTNFHYSRHLAIPYNDVEYSLLNLSIYICIVLNVGHWCIFNWRSSAAHHSQTHSRYVHTSAT